MRWTHYQGAQLLFKARIGACHFVAVLSWGQDAVLVSGTEQQGRRCFTLAIQFPQRLSQLLPEGKQLVWGFFIPHFIRLQIISPENGSCRTSPRKELARASKSTFTSAF